MGAHTICSCSHGQTLRADLEREDLSRNNPRNRPPCGCKEKDEYADERDSRLLGCNIVDDDVSSSILGGGGCAENGDEKLTDGHADGAPEEKGAAANLVNRVETGQGGGDVNGAGDHLDDECVGNSRVFKVLSSVARRG